MGKGEATVFEAVGLIGNALILLASLIILDRASDLTINSSVKVSEIAGFGRTTVGFVFVDFSMSLPVLSVSIFAIFSQASIGVTLAGTGFKG